jgi:uncharacterized membrane protein YedE/YeeE
MSTKQLFAVLLAGVLFGFGLALSTMVNPTVVLAFLRWQDFGLLLVLGGATTLTFVAYQSLPRLMRRPLFGAQFDRHPAAMDARTLGGAALFGIGWGISGVCPGPAIAGLGTGNFSLLWVVLAMALGAWVQGRFFAPRS